MRQLYFIVILLICSPLRAAKESQLWLQFKKAKLTGTTPELSDFSYAGYDYSETAIPDISTWPKYDVTDYGAVANDGRYDDKAIQDTIDAAASQGGGVVFFPPGRFMVSPNTTVGENLFVRTSNIVLKGSGTDKREIFKDKMKVNNGRYIFEIGPKIRYEQALTKVVAEAKRETYTIEVANNRKLAVGQRIILTTDSVEFAKKYYAPQRISPQWTRLLGQDRRNGKEGFRLREVHTIAKIEGNLITFREPLHTDLYLVEEDIFVRDYPVITNVGVQDLRFKGNWDAYPETFVHHLNQIHDYAYNALRIDNVANGWVRNVEFRDWNQSLYLDGAQAFTIEKVIFSGKKGHTSIHARRGYGVLVKDAVDLAGHHHGPGVGYWGTGTVYLRYQMADAQRIDSHSGSPYATLFDYVLYGQLYGSGGPHKSYPHHGKYFTFWNFIQKGGRKHYDFWPDKRNGNTFAMPYFIGLRGSEANLVEGTFGANELQGVVAQPQSLFEAQLTLRLESDNYGIDYAKEPKPEFADKK